MGDHGSAATLSAYLDSHVAHGAWRAGIKLRAERELSERVATSRGAVRKVIDAFIWTKCKPILSIHAAWHWDGMV